jgi:hypothetical protein
MGIQLSKAKSLKKKSHFAKDKIMSDITSYIFVKPTVSKVPLEDEINSFLNQTHIYQIHLKEALQTYAQIKTK